MRKFTCDSVQLTDVTIALCEAKKWNNTISIKTSKTNILTYFRISPSNNPNLNQKRNETKIYHSDCEIILRQQYFVNNIFVIKVDEKSQYLNFFLSPFQNLKIFLLPKRKYYIFLSTFNFPSFAWFKFF